LGPFVAAVGADEVGAVFVGVFLGTLRASWNLRHKVYGQFENKGVSAGGMAG
jgi:hypothetical protein